MHRDTPLMPNRAGQWPRTASEGCLPQCTRPRALLVLTPPLRPLHLGLPTLPVPGLKLGLWSLPLAWRPQLPGSIGKEKLPRAPEASHGFEQAGL